MEAQQATVKTVGQVLTQYRKETTNYNGKPRRTTEGPYVAEYRKHAICTIPYGEEHWEFSFSVRKAEAIQGMIDSGKWGKMLEVARIMQSKIDARESDVIVL